MVSGNIYIWRIFVFSNQNAKSITKVMIMYASLTIPILEFVLRKGMFFDIWNYEMYISLLL